MSYLTCDHQFHRDFGGPRPTIVVLCGSTRFRDEFQEENRRLTLAGCIVLAPGVFGHAGDPAPTEAEKAALDELHFRKIDLADRVVVINPGGYVGDSTRREIDYAISCGKVISWLEGREDTPEALNERLRPAVCHCSTTQHDSGIELHPDADCPVHGENRPTVEGIADVAEKPAPTAWCGDPDHDDPCNNCDDVLIDAADALRQRMPGGERP